MNGRADGRWILRLIAAAVAATLSLSLFGCGDGTDSNSKAPDSRETADPDGKALVDSKCSMCHTLERVYSANKTREEWITTVTRMKSNGLVVTDEEFDRVIGFLSQQ